MKKELVLHISLQTQLVSVAFLDNMVAVIQDEIQPNGDTLITAWEWRGEE